MKYEYHSISIVCRILRKYDYGIHENFGILSSRDIMKTLRGI